MKDDYLLLDSDKYDHVKMGKSKRRKETIRPRSKNMKRNFKKEYISQALYYIAVLAIIVGAFLFFNKLNKTSNTIKLQNIELKSTQYRLQELNAQYDKVLQDKTAGEAEKASQEQRVQELERQKTELERQLQSKLAEKQRVASLQTAKAFAAQANCDTPKMCIYMKESGNNPLAVNSIGCRGIGQACPGTKLPCGADYACQDAWFTNYAITRYGSWDAAWVFWQQNHWW